MVINSSLDFFENQAPDAFKVKSRNVTIAQARLILYSWWMVCLERRVGVLFQKSVVFTC